MKVLKILYYVDFSTDWLTYSLTYLLTYLLTYSLTYLLMLSDKHTYIVHLTINFQIILNKIF